MSDKFVAGVDEAGRGPVIGPMVMSIAAFEEDDLITLETLGIKDSKLLSPHERNLFFDKVNEICVVKTIVISPQEIDAAVSSPSSNLNMLEEEVAAKLIDELAQELGAFKLKKVILDCPSTNIAAYTKSMQSRIKRDVVLQAEHKADLKYPIVGAASIIAKVTRDRLIEDLKKECGVDFGSGYPGDAKTAAFVRDYYDKFDFFRKTWATYKRVVADNAQQSLGGFGVEKTLSPALQKKKDELLELHGFEEVETKGVAEVVRVKKPGCTITLYTSGKILVQGKEKDTFSHL